MKNLVVHVGAHKTGSTFIQNTMKANLKSLNKGGVGYFGGEEARINFTRNILYPAVGLRECWQSRDELTGEAQGLLKAKFGNMDSLLLSNENIPGYCDLTLNGGLIYPKAKEAFEFIKGLEGAWSTKVVFFIRSYADFIESTYVQKVKEGYCYNFDDYKKECRPERFSWLGVVDSLYSTFGSENVLLVKYESFRSEQEKGLEDIVSLLSTDPIELKVDTGRNVNPSYSGVALELARLANSVIDKSDLSDYRNFLTKRFPISKYGRVSLLSKEERELFSKKYEDDCQCIGV